MDYTFSGLNISHNIAHFRGFFLRGKRFGPKLEAESKKKGLFYGTDE